MILFVTYCRWWRACHVLMSQGNEKLREVHRTERNLKRILRYQIIFIENIAMGFVMEFVILIGCWLHLDWIIVAKLTLIIESNHIILYVTRSSADADNRLDAFSGQSRSTNMVPFHMLHIDSYCAIVTLSLRSTSIGIDVL